MKKDVIERLVELRIEYCDLIWESRKVPDTDMAFELILKSYVPFDEAWAMGYELTAMCGILVVGS